MAHLGARGIQHHRGAKMLKALFGKRYSKKFLDRVAFRRAGYYEKRKIQAIRDNAMKMAMNWSHEYPTGTPLAYIRDDIIECWERTATAVEDQEHLDTVTPTKKYVHNWRNPPDEINDIPYKIEGTNEKT